MCSVTTRTRSWQRSRPGSTRSGTRRCRSTWERFLNDHQLLVESLSFEELANDAQVGGEQPHLKNPIEDYALVVVDEAHNYRNPDTAKRAAVLRRLLAGKRRDLLLLTATPVNNSLWDLYHLLRFFMKQDAWLADRGVLSIRERFEHAMREDPFSLSPDLLYPIIDATTVKRTRRFIKKHYSSDLIRGPDGRMVPIRFPKPLASSIGYDLDVVLPGFFTRLEEILMPADGHPPLRMARYQPELYPAGGSAGGGDTALVGLLRSALLKRFESSAEAFRQTLGRMIHEHDVFLKALTRGRVVRKEFFREVSAAEDIEEFIEASEHVEDASAYDVPRLAADVRSDLELLREMETVAGRVRPESDPKLAALVEELAAIAKQAADEGLDEEDARQKRKVLVFSHYEDTIDWIEEHLGKVIARDPRLAPYRGRVASVSGTEVRGGISRGRALHEAPIERGATGEQSFAEAREEIEKLHCGDASIYEAGGTVGAAQTGEEYRQELRRGLEKLGDAIRDLPWRVGSGMRKGAHEGHVFCATVGDRIYLRFVPFEPEGEIVGELGTCLRLLECTEDTRRVLSGEMPRAAYGAWERARKSILEAWTFETDPANLQPRIRKLNREVAAFLRSIPAPGVDQERLKRCLDALESPWSRREERLLRTVWEGGAASESERARELVEMVERIGAEPFHAPDALPPIDREEIHLIAWLAIGSEA